MSGAHSGMTFELVHVTSNDIRFPLIYRFERTYLVDRRSKKKIYPWDLSLFHQREAKSYFKDCLNVESSE